MLGKIFSGGAADLVKGVGSVIDNLHTSAEEKLAAENKIKELIANYEVEMEKNITSRWKADMNSDSWLSKNVRPLVLIFLVDTQLGVPGQTENWPIVVGAFPAQEEIIMQDKIEIIARIIVFQFQLIMLSIISILLFHCLL